MSSEMIGARAELERYANDEVGNIAYLTKSEARALVAALDMLAEYEQFVRDARPLLGIGYGNSLGARADDLLTRVENSQARSE